MMKKIALITLLSLTAGICANAQDNSVKTPKGAVVKVVTSNPGDKIKPNDVITFDVVQKTEKDSVLFSSYMLGHPLKIQVQPCQNVGDLMDALPLLAAKDSACIKVPTDSVFKDHEEQRPAFLKKGSWLVFNVKIDKIQSLQQAIDEKNAVGEKMKTEETADRDKYIASHNLIVKTTPSGLKYVITQPSLKPKPLAGDTVLVNYIGRTTGDKVFDSSIQAEAQKAGLNQPGRNYEPLPVVVGTGSVIKGWDEGLLLLNEGSKAKLIIPSNLGYGPEGAGDAIAPYSTLVFDVELVKIKPIKHAMAPKPAAKKTTTATKKHTVAKKKS
ncbi:FKBP-type peptidyl-prolyl cis-trans isomerase [Mucilaginibacter sp. BT774]|uniref:FKBP-type peptidyl-prolyl cis-trans isomerase n=1 Tax=Mucilaginibacter sp. BT774 TaxID=3062276 RepID=UPI002676EE43|nr:FKBP-type peptidyl-prolyl cis-trans isomerase [Mucilaginibacter sp. BT774]MDO3625622.1 FKBP-type peptidyl-prolyl cis-trans isomerase [Mucilaginibacter sp. BT774]